MKIMVNLEGTDNYQEFDINENLSILDLKANISTVFDFSWNEMELLLNDQPLANHLILGKIDINDNVIILRRTKSNLASSRSVFGSSQGSSISQRGGNPSLSQVFSQYMNNQRNGNNNNYYNNNNINNNNYNPLGALFGSFRMNAKEQFIKKKSKRTPRPLFDISR